MTTLLILVPVILSIAVAVVVFMTKGFDGFDDLT